MEIPKHFRAVKLWVLAHKVDCCVGIKLLILSHMGPGWEIWLSPGGTMGSTAVLLPGSLAKIWGVFW